MNYWNQAPFSKFLPAFVAGIIFSVFVPGLQPIPILCFAAAPFILLTLQILLSEKFYSYKYRWTFGLSVHILVFIFACVLTIYKTEINYNDHFSKIKNAEQYIAVIDKPLNEKAKSFKTTLIVRAVKTINGWKKTTGNCLTYISKDEISSQLKYGDLIIFNQSPGEVLPPGNPSQFNYKRWLGFNGVFHQVYIAEGGWQLLAHHQGNWLFDLSNTLRDNFLKVFRDNHITGQDYAVLSALILGDTDEIDQETINAYQASGALHVLSVSGMHVGIIYLALNALLFFLERDRKSRIMKASIIVIFLWFYAMLTGLSPAVLRAAMMLTIIVIGKYQRQSANMYNTLAASAMLLCLFNPYLIMQVGFQLSYLAVLGIVFLQPKINQWWDAPNWFMRQVWSITSVSLAAQIATFPLGILYFHQFPLYFLFSNLIVIPVSTIIIYGGIVLLAIYKWAFVVGIFGYWLGRLVHFLNSIVTFIEHLPAAVIDGKSISVFETILIYVLLLSLVLFLMHKEAKYLIVSLSFLVLVSLIELKEFGEQNNQHQFIVYNVPKKSAINFIDGGSCLLIADTALSNNKSMMLFNIAHYWWDCGINDVDVVFKNKLCENNFLNNKKYIQTKSNFIFYRGKNILICDDKKLLGEIHPMRMHLDYVILSNNVKIKIVSLIERFDIKQIIIDSSNKNWYTKKWMTEAKSLGVKCYSVNESGAFLANL